MDPYERRLFKENPFSAKKNITCSIVAVLQAKVDNRGLHLIKPISRAVKKNDIHELILTDEKEARPGKVVNKISYIGFVEILRSGIIVVGDEVYYGKYLLGTVVGFDDTHIPNHQNIVLFSSERETGKDLDIQLDDEVIIQSNRWGKTN